jgi:Tfp pilus assembly protein PilF
MKKLSGAALFISLIFLSACAGKKPAPGASSAPDPLAAFQPGTAAAFEYLKSRTAGDRDEAAILTNLAVVALQTGRVDLGKENLQKAIRSNARYSRAFLELAQLTKQEGDMTVDPWKRRHSYLYALESANMYQELCPGCPEGLGLAGGIFFVSGDWEEARVAYEMVLDRAPFYPEVHERLALIARQNQDRVLEKEELAKAKKSLCRDDAYYIQQAKFSLWEADYAMATAQYEKALRMNPRNFEALLGLGKSLYYEGRSKLALAVLARAVQEAPGRAEPLLFIGKTYLRMGEPLHAERELVAHQNLESPKSRPNREEAEELLVVARQQIEERHLRKSASSEASAERGFLGTRAPASR